MQEGTPRTEVLPVGDKVSHVGAVSPFGYKVCLTENQPASTGGRFCNDTYLRHESAAENNADPLHGGDVGRRKTLEWPDVPGDEHINSLLSKDKDVISHLSSTTGLSHPEDPNSEFVERYQCERCGSCFNNLIEAEEHEAACDQNVMREDTLATPEIRATPKDHDAACETAFTLECSSHTPRAPLSPTSA